MLNPDAEVELLAEGHCQMKVGSVSWQVIERGGRHGIRIRDRERPARIRLRARTYYPIQSTYRVCAKLETLNDRDSIRLKNVLDMEYALPLVGLLRFELGGQSQELLALDGGPDQLFLAITDETTGEKTYGGGRYLDLTIPEGDSLEVDFNLCP